MKKVISTILALVMVLAVVATVPMTVSAEGETLNTTRYFATNSTTGLDAYYGTPAIGTWLANAKATNNSSFGKINSDADFTTLMDSTWNNAYKLTVNSSTSSNFVGYSGSSSDDYDVYILWDENNLYFLADVRHLKETKDDYTIDGVKNYTGVAGQWGGALNEELMGYNVLLPAKMENYGDDYTGPANFFISSVPCLNDSSVQGIDVYEGVVRVRRINYKNTTGNTDGKPVISWSDSFDSGNGMRAFVEKVSTGYRIATVVPWSTVDTEGTFEATVGKTIGVKIYNNGSNHISHGGYTVDGTPFNGDTAGHDPVTLCAAATNTNYNAVATTIAPDYDHWLGENGQFTKTPPVTIVDDKATAATKATYYINDAGDLLALAHLLETEAYNGTRLAPFKFTAKGDKTMLSEDKTFKLTADIDLNPGVDWEKANDFLVKKNNGEACDFAKIGTPMPVNVFVGFDWFYGIIDGQGYSIKGVYNPETNSVSKRSNGNTNDMGGFVGRLGQGGFVDLVIESGYVGTGVLKENGQFGGIVANVYAGGKTDASVGIIISNLYVGSNYTVHRYGVRTAGETNSYPIAGVVTTMWSSGASKVPVVYKNIVFNGTLIDKYSQENSEYGYQAYLFGRARTSNVGGGYSKVTIEDCIVNGASKKFAAVTETDNNTVIKRCDFVQTVAEGKVTIPEANAGYWVALNDGTAAPIKIADKYTDFKWQATAAENGKYAVRLVGELDSLNYNDAKFIVTLTGTKNGVTKTMTVDFTADKTPALAYSSLIANGQTVTADDVDFGMVEGDYFFVAVLNNLDTSVTYEVSAQAVYTLADGTVVTGVAQDLGQVAAWTNN